MGGEFTRLVSLADLITHAVPLSKNGEEVIYTNTPITKAALARKSRRFASSVGDGD